MGFGDFKIFRKREQFFLTSKTEFCDAKQRKSIKFTEYFVKNSDCKRDKLRTFLNEKIQSIVFYYLK